MVYDIVKCALIKREKGGRDITLSLPISSQDHNIREEKRKERD